VVLSDFDGVHAGEDVWVVGSDSSMDWFPEGFFDGRIVVCVNAPHVPCRYVVSKADGSDGWVRAQALEHPAVHHVVSRHPNGSLRTAKVQLDDLANVTVYDHAENQCDGFSAGRDVPTDPARLLVSWSTLGSAMHFAARLGARNVFMLGVSGGAFGGETHRDGYRSGGPIAGMSLQTQPIADRLAELYGTTFVTVLPWANLRCGGVSFRSEYGALN
jgi:hypothetical protein